MNALTWALVKIVELVKWWAIVSLEKLEIYRQKRGYTQVHFETTLTEEQIYSMAMGLKLRPWERRNLSKLSEKTIIRQYDISRRQARKVLEMYRTLFKNAPKMSA